MAHRYRPRCTVCRHPERLNIELQRAAGATLEALGEKYGLQKDAIHRHYNRHVTAEMKASYLCGPTELHKLAERAAETGTSVVDCLHAIRVTQMAALARVSEAGDGRSVAYIGTALTKTLEVLARVTGEIGDMARSVTTVNNITNVAVLNEHPAFLRIQATLLRALGPYPDARAAVVAALRGADVPSATAATEGLTIEHRAA